MSCTSLDGACRFGISSSARYAYKLVLSGRVSSSASRGDTCALSANISQQQAPVLPLVSRVESLVLGERVVADHLQDLAASGWHIFHDIQGDGFNIDHVVIGRGGIFTVETKTRSKPPIKRARIIVDQNGISVAGGAASRDAIEQALAQSSWLAKQLRSSTGQAFPVRAAIVFPNWFVTRKTRPKSGDPWVLEPKGLVKWLKKERASLNDEQVAMAAHHLTRLIKAGERN